MNSVYAHLPLLQIFLKVAEQGSFQRAAVDLDLPRSSVSKKIQQLEQILGQPLFKRTTRKLTITEFGMALRQQAEELPLLVTRIDRLIDQVHIEAAGRVSISTSALLGQRFIIPLLTDLREALPRVVLDISFNDEYVDLVEGRVDIALRVGTLPNSSLIAKQVGLKSWGWFASPSYLTSQGEPTQPSDLQSHPCLVFKTSDKTMNHWIFSKQGEATRSLHVDASITTDNSRALVDMTCAGLGISMLDSLAIEEELSSKKLVPVLTQWTHPETLPINLVSLSKVQRSRAVECVWQHLSQRLRIN